MSDEHKFTRRATLGTSAASLSALALSSPAAAQDVAPAAGKPAVLRDPSSKHPRPPFRSQL